MTQGTDHISNPSTNNQFSKDLPYASTKEMSLDIPEFRLCPGFHLSSLLFSGLCYNPSWTQSPNNNNELQTLNFLFPNTDFGPDGCNFYKVRTEDGRKFINSDIMVLSYALNNILLPNPREDQRNVNHQFGSYYFYDRNPNVIQNLVSILYHSFLFTIPHDPVDRIICLDNKPNPTSVIHSQFFNYNGSKLEQLYFFLTKCFPTLFYSEKGIRIPDLPTKIQFSNAKGNPPFVNLYLALGSANQEIHLLLFLNGSIFLISDEYSKKVNNIDEVRDMSIYILIYIPNTENNSSIKYDIANRYKTKPTIPSIYSGGNLSTNDYAQPLFGLISQRANKWKRELYTLEEYLIDCIQFPAAFVKGTKLDYEKYSKYLSIIFSYNTSFKDNFKPAHFSSEQNRDANHLFANYQKFLRFTRYIIMIINSFLNDNFNEIEQRLPYLFGTIPILNQWLLGSSLKLLDFICSQNEAVQKKYKILYGATFAHAQNHINLVEEAQKESAFSRIWTIPYAVGMLKSAFDGLKKKLNDPELSFIPKFGSSIKNDEYIIINSAKEYIFETINLINDIGFL